MFLRSIYLLCLLEITNAQDPNQEQLWNVASTTESSKCAPSEDSNNRLKAMEDRLKLLEKQNEQIQQTLERILHLQQEKAESGDKMTEQLKACDNKFKQLESGLEQIEEHVISKVEQGQKDFSETVTKNIVNKNKELEHILGNLLLVQQRELVPKVEALTRQHKTDDDTFNILEKNQRKLKDVSDNLEQWQNTFSKFVARHFAPANCQEVLASGRTASGVYSITPNPTIKPFEVFCDMTTKQGGWAYVLNRFDGSQDFYLNFKNYKDGFGNLTGEFWMGLDHLYQLTAANDTELLLELTDWENKTEQAHYANFAIGSEDEKYTLKSVSGFNGSIGDSLSYNVGYTFTAKDSERRNCATQYTGAWWYRGTCFKGCLTGKYQGPKAKFGTGIHWYAFHGYGYSLKAAKMMIRPRN